MSDPILWLFGAQDPISDDAYSAVIAKGAKLLQMLELNNHDAGQLMNPPRPTAQSKFTSKQALTDNDYINVSVESDLDKKAMQSLKAAFEGIGANAELVCNGGTNHVVEHCHNHSLKHLNTAASFQQICNPAQGVLIASANDSPSSIARRNSLFTAPSLRYWSDVAYLQWLEACDNSSSEPRISVHDPAPIRFVLRLRMLNPITWAAAQRAVASRGHQTFACYPGETFDMDSEQGKAILGTPNGAGVAWLLIQRKRELGHATVKDVTVFCAHYEGMSPGDCPSLLLRIAETDAHGGL